MKGLCAALTSHAFHHGSKNSADLMRTSWEKVVQYVGTKNGMDISNELENKVTLVIGEPQHSATALTRHATREQMVRTSLKQDTGSNVVSTSSSDPLTLYRIIEKTTMA